jgi:hypothetical protein
LCLDDGVGRLPDEIGDIQLVAVNEYGAMTLLWGLKNVRIMACGSGISIDDMVIEEQYTYVAEEFIPGRKLKLQDFSVSRGSRTVHTKRVEINDSPEKKAMIEEAVALTADEPSDLLTDIVRVLDRHKVIL